MPAQPRWHGRLRTQLPQSAPKPLSDGRGYWTLQPVSRQPGSTPKLRRTFSAGTKRVLSLCFDTAQEVVTVARGKGKQLAYTTPLPHQIVLARSERRRCC